MNANVQPENLDPDPSLLRAPRLVAESSDIETFLASSERLFQKQRSKLQEEQAAYHWERFKRLQDFDERAHRLLNERDEAIRALDARHAKTQADGQRMLKALSGLRDG